MPPYYSAYYTLHLITQQCFQFIYLSSRPSCTLSSLNFGGSRWSNVCLILKMPQMGVYNKRMIFNSLVPLTLLYGTDLPVVIVSRLSLSCLTWQPAAMFSLSSLAGFALLTCLSSVLASPFPVRRGMNCSFLIFFILYSGLQFIFSHSLNRCLIRSTGPVQLLRAIRGRHVLHGRWKGQRRRTYRMLSRELSSNPGLERYIDLLVWWVSGDDQVFIKTCEKSQIFTLR